MINIVSSVPGQPLIAPEPTLLRNSPTSVLHNQAADSATDVTKILKNQKNLQIHEFFDVGRVRQVRCVRQVRQEMVREHLFNPFKSNFHQLKKIIKFGVNRIKWIK